MAAAQPALENRPSVDDPTGADRTADLVLGAAVLAMGLIAGLYFFSAIAVMPALTAADDRARTRPSSSPSSALPRSPRSPSIGRAAPTRPRSRAGSSPPSPSTR
jgi:hypothetical protein